MRTVTAIFLLIAVCAVIAFGFGIAAILALTDYSAAGIMDDPYPWSLAIEIVKDHLFIFGGAFFLVGCLAIFTALSALCPTVERP